MASSSNRNLLILGSVLVLAGVGGYLLYRHLKAGKDANKPSDSNDSSSQGTPGTTANNPSSQPTSSGSSSTGRPTAPDAIKAFQTYAKNAGLYSGAIDGTWGPKSQKAWDAVGVQYQQSLVAPPSAPQTQPDFSQIKSQMISPSAWGNNIRVTEETSSRIRYALDVKGILDLYISITPTGTFWVEFYDQRWKYTGQWTFSNGVYTLTWNDGSYSSSSTNFAQAMKAVMKNKYPDQMSTYS